MQVCVELRSYSSERMFFSKSGQNQIVPQENNRLCSSQYTSRLKLLTRVTPMFFFSKL